MPGSALSKDIDFFIRDVQWLGFITPRLNDVIAAMVEGYEEQANSLKLILPAEPVLESEHQNGASAKDKVWQIKFPGL